MKGFSFLYLGPIALFLLGIFLYSISWIISPPVSITSNPTMAASASEIYFPRSGDDPAPILASLYGNSTSTLDIAIYSLTHPVIVEAINSAAKRGVRVRIISDKIQSAGATQKHAINDLLLNNIPIKINDHSGLMHLKMSIIDGAITTIGSYNYSMNASERNDEIMIIDRNPTTAALCQAEFNKMWNDTIHYIPAKMSY